ncbi:MAG: hypothetical protein SGBAC_000544 [Bacillariaceae sp.]
MMSQQDSIHRQHALEKSQKAAFLAKQKSTSSFLTYNEIDEEDEADIVVPCVTQDEEDEEAQPSTLPQASVHSLEDDTATEIWTEDESFGGNSRSEIDALTEQLETRRIGIEHDEENYGIETYLNHYETMLQRQEDENVATLTHLKPMLAVLESLVKGKASGEVANRNTLDYDRTAMLKEFRLPELKRGYKQLKQESIQYDFIRTDRQFMLVLELLTQTSMTHQSVSWAEIAHCYKICISGMQVLEELPAGRMRNQIKERTVASLQGPRVPKVPTSILKKTSKPSGLTSVTTSSSSPTVSPLASSEIKPNSNFQDESKIGSESKSDSTVAKMSDAHEADVKEMNMLKLIIAFLLGLVISMTMISQPNAPETASINILLEQLSEAKAVAAKASISAALEASHLKISTTPQTQIIQLQPHEADMKPVMEEATQRDTNLSIPDAHIVESDSNETALSTFNAPKSTSTLAIPSVSSLPEVRTWGGIAVAAFVAPAALQAVVGVASSSLFLPLAVVMIAATSSLEGVREAVLGWLQRLRSLRKS